MLSDLLTYLVAENPDSINQILNYIYIAIAIGYFMPLLFILHDIAIRYKNKRTQILLFLSATFLLPVFAIPYLAFRKSTTRNEDKVLEKDLEAYLKMNELKECKDCKSYIKVTQKYCEHCGNYNIINCTNCEAIINPEWKHCISCGVEQVLVEEETEEEFINEISPIENINIPAIQASPNKVTLSFAYKTNNSQQLNNIEFARI